MSVIWTLLEGSWALETSPVSGLSEGTPTGGFVEATARHKMPGMRRTDEDAFRDSFRGSDSKRSGFYEPSFSNRGTRKLQAAYKRRPIWPKVAVVLILVCAALMAWVRFGAR